MELIKEIRDLSAEITALKDSVKKYDSEISQANVSAAKMAKMFDGYKGAKASAMSMEELEKATRKLIDGYNELEKAQNQYAQRQQALLNLQSRLKEQQNILPQAQRQALSNGDQAGAERLYQQYMSNAQALAQVEVEIRNAQSSMSTFNGVMTESATIANRYEGVLAAMRDAQGNINIDQLNAALREEKNNLADLSNQMREYIIYIKETQEKIKNGKIAPEDVEEKTAELEGMRNKVAELKNEYTAAAERARVFARAAGQDPNKISLTPQNLPSMQPKGVKFPEVDKNLKAAADATKGVNTGLDDMIKKGLRFAGLSFGAGQLLNFGRQVMSVRGEFQQLEVAFTTLLGSEQKAQKLMQQLTKTAATTPFDLQSVSRGAKQLLAYGTAAEDVNDILVHLGDIAAGLSQPLDALVYLYGTTMVQGKMMTMDLRQFQNRGIPIAEQLAKQFGVAKSEVQGLVSSGRVTAEEFHKAIMAMSSDGGKFGGLMAAQAKTIGGQISNIQDNISMMFNEIGKKSEGVINAGLGAVATLVENYETVGKTILALIATYGTYKTALIVVTALEKAKAATALYNLVSGQKAISVTKMLTTTTWKQVKAQLASNAAMLANPAIWITTAIVGLVAGTIAMARALDSERKAQDKLNKSKKEQQELLDNAKSESDSAISTLQSETATAYEKAKAYDTLKRILPQLTDNYTQAQIASMSLEQAQKAQAKALEDLKFEEKRKEIEKYRQEVARLQQESSNDYIDTNKIDALGNPVYNHGNAINNANLLAAQEAQKQAEKELAQMEAERKKAQEQEDFQKLPIAKQIEQLKAEKQELQDQFDGLQFKAIRGIIHPLELTLLEQLKKDLAGLTTQIDTLEQAPDDLGELTKQILDAEKAVDVARKTYAANMSEGNKKNVDTAVANLKTLTDKYKDATGQQWTATEQMLEQKTKEERKASRESEDIVAREYSKRYQLALQHQRELEDLETEKKEWQKKNPNRAVPEYFAQRQEVIELKFKADFAKLDEEFNDWIEGIQRETVQINTEVDISELERAIDLADNYNTKLEKREEINKKQIAAKNAELNLEKKQTAESQFGEQTVKDFATFDKETGKYTNAEGEEVAATNDEKVVFSQLERFYTEFENKRNAIIGQMKQDYANEQLNEDLQRFEEYVQGMLDAETAYQEELARIREENGLSADADIENSKDKGIQAQVQKAKDQRDTAQKIITRDTGITDDTMVTELAELGAKVAGKAYDEVKKLYDEFIQSVNDDIAEVEAQKVAAENIASGGDAKTLKEEAEKSLSSVETQLPDPNLTEQQKVDLLQQQLDLKAQIAYYDAAEQGNAESLNSLTERGAQLVKIRSKAESSAANAQQKANVKELTQQQKLSVANKAIVQGLEEVRDMANAVANTFGGALSKKGKKALTAMTQVADFGIDAVKGIETIVSGVSNGMIKTTEGASKSMQALEKASFILTIISIAVQLIMKIVEIASQFTKSAQLQNSIDDHLAKVDELEKKQQMIEAQYATSQGSDYYKGLAKSAEEYNAIIKENKAALEDAEELYQHNLSKYGEDSDKTQEAKAQRDDLALQDVEFQNSQIEAWRGLMEELSGTSLDSFAENLADSLIEGFAMGKEGIDGVWEDTMDDLLRTMMRNQLATALKDQFQSTFDSLTNATKDGDLSQAEMEEFMNNLEAGKETAEQIAGAYYDVMSEAGLLDDADAEGSQGFGQMTQDQADTLTARFTAVQMEMANVSANTQAMAGVVSLVGEDIKLGVASIQSLLYNSNIALQMAQDQLDQMQIIADNTAMLAETNTRLKAIEQNTGRL